MPIAVTVLAPAYNEEAVIADYVHTVSTALHDDWELLIVDDGSVDRTPELLVGLAAEHPRVRIVTHERNRGLGAALNTGFAAAAGEIVVTMDADLSHPLPLTDRLVAACGNADAAFAGRFVPGGGMIGVPLLRRLISQIGNLGLRLLFRSPVRDLSTGFRAYRTAALRGITVESSGFEVQMEIAVRLLASGATIVELPLLLENRAAGESKMSYLKLIPRYARLVPRLLLLRWLGR